MKKSPAASFRAFRFPALFLVLMLMAVVSRADVIVLENGEVVIGNILQQDANGVLFQTSAGTWRYPLPAIREIKKEAAAAPHVANNGRPIPDWAQIVTRLSVNPWADGVQQVPATVINYGTFQRVPYVSFRAASGGYELNIFGDLDAPAAVQFGAVGYLKDDLNARSNCVNFICSLLASDGMQAAVRALPVDAKQVGETEGFTVQNLMPGEMGSYGGWWVSVENRAALNAVKATENELAGFTQSAGPPPPAPAPDTATSSAPASSQPATAYAYASATSSGGGYYFPYGWTREELANARPHPLPATQPAPVTVGAANPENPLRVYPRNYYRTAGGYTRRAR